MNIVHINSLYTPYQIGGAEKSVQILAEAQAALGHRVTVLCTAPEGEARDETRAGVTVRYLPVRNLYRPFTGSTHGAAAKALWHLIDTWNPMMASLVRRHLVDLQPDVVNTHTIAGFSTAVWGVVKELGIPLVHTLRDYYLACPRSTMFRGDDNCAQPCASCAPFAAPRRRASALVDAVIGNSRFILDRHLALGYFGGARIRSVILSGQPADALAEPPRAPRPEGVPPVFGYIGQIAPTKGIGLLIEALSALGPGVRLRVAGRIDSDYGEALRRTAPAGVEWLGWQKPADFYRSVDIVVVPSLWHEPLPRTVIEASAHGCRVIGSDRGGTPEALAVVGGAVFDPAQPGALAKLLHQECTSRPAAETPIGVASAFAPAARALDHLRLYETVLA